MIRIQPPQEPDEFEAQCRQPGSDWLAENPDGDPPSRFWRPFVIHLCHGFNCRCGYSAMFNMDGTVDHYLSQSQHRDLAYEWSNLRYVSGWLNSTKQALDQRVLDPFRVRDEWFEIELPSLVLHLTPCVPITVRAVAEFTLMRLHLADGDRVYDQRRTYYDTFLNPGRPLWWLEEKAPLIATAVRRQRLLTHLAANPPVTRQQAAQVCETTEAGAMRLIQVWVRAGHLVSQGRGRNVRYRRP